MQADRTEDAGHHSRRAAIALLTTVAYMVVVLLLPMRTLWPSVLAACAVAVAWIRVRVSIRTSLLRFVPLEVALAGLGVAALIRPEIRSSFLAATIKGHLCLAAVVVLTSACSATDLLAALRRLGCPALVCDTLSIMWRYLPLMQEESSRLQRARDSRTYAKNRGRTWWMRSEILTQLFLRGLARAERVYLAMCSRGWK